MIAPIGTPRSGFFKKPLMLQPVANPAPASDRSKDSSEGPCQGFQKVWCSIVWSLALCDSRCSNRHTRVGSTQGSLQTECQHFLGLSVFLQKKFKGSRYQSACCVSEPAAPWLTFWLPHVPCSPGSSQGFHGKLPGPDAYPWRVLPASRPPNNRRTKTKQS